MLQKPMLAAASSDPPESCTAEVRFSSIRSLVIPVYLPRALSQLASALVTVVLPLQILALGYNYDTVGFVMAAMGAGLFLGNYPAGSLTSHHGPHAVAMGSFAMLLAGAAICVVAPGAIFLSVGAFLVGCSESSEVIARQIYVTATTEPQILGRALSTLGAMKRVGFAVGPMLGGLVSRHFGPQAVYLLQCGISVIGLLWTYVLMPPADADTKVDSGSATPRARTGSDFEVAGVIRKHWRTLLSVELFVMSLVCVRSSRNLLLPMRGHDISLAVDDIGYLMSLSYLVDGLLFPLAGWLLDNSGRNRTGMLCTGSYAIALLTLEGRSIFWITVFALLSGWANGISSGIVMTIGADLAPPSARGPFIGVFRTVARVAELVAPLLVGLLAKYCSLPVAVLANVAVAAFGCVWVSCCMQTVAPPQSSGDSKA